MHKLLAGASVTLVLGCADAVAWRIGTNALAAGTDRWIADARRQGWTVTEAGRSFGGWPFSATLAIAAPSITGGEGLGWSSRRLVLAVSVLHPTRLALFAEGRQAVHVSGLPDLAFTGARLAASIRLWGDAQELVLIDAARVSGGLAGPHQISNVQIGSLHLSVADTAGPAWPAARLDVQATGIGLPDTMQWPLGAVVSTLSATLLLRSPAPGAARQDREASQLQAWRDAGGRLVVQQMGLHWGTLKLAGAADLALDGRLQPAGTGTADITGSQATLDALAGAGVITSTLAATAGAMLVFMPQTPGDPASVRLPIVLKDSTVSLGQIPVLHLKPISWR